MLEPKDIPAKYPATVEDILLEVLNKIEAALPGLAGQAGMDEKTQQSITAAITDLPAGKSALWLNPNNTTQAYLIFKTADGRQFFQQLTMNA
jgi:hypothetical protein